MVMTSSTPARIKLQIEKLQFEWMEIFTFQFEVAVRVRLNIETLTLIIRPQSAIFLGGLRLLIRVRDS